jgi:hypothetical protein
MTESELVEMYLLRALSQNEPAPISALVVALRQQAEGAGLLPPGQVDKLDDVLVGRALVEWGRREPPLVDSEYAPAALLPHGNVREGAERLWSLTDEGDVELNRLERLVAGVV